MPVEQHSLLYQARNQVLKPEGVIRKSALVSAVNAGTAVRRVIKKIPAPIQKQERDSPDGKKGTQQSTNSGRGKGSSNSNSSNGSGLSSKNSNTNAAINKDDIDGMWVMVSRPVNKYADLYNFLKTMTTCQS